MTGDPRLALVQHAADLKHRQLLMGQQGEDTQACRLSGRAQHIDNLDGGDRHAPHKDIFMWLCQAWEQRSGGLPLTLIAPFGDGL